MPTRLSPVRACRAPSTGDACRHRAPPDLRSSVTVRRGLHVRSTPRFGTPTVSAPTCATRAIPDRRVPYGRRSHPPRQRWSVPLRVEAGNSNGATALRSVCRGVALTIPCVGQVEAVQHRLADLRKAYYMHELADSYLDARRTAAGHYMRVGEN